MKKQSRHTTPPGLEWRLFKALPRYLLAGTAIPLMMSFFARIWPMDRINDEAQKFIMSIDILSIALAITAWTAVFTIAIGCIVVIIMKGPRYQADAYPLQDSNHPHTNKKPEDKH